MSDNIKHNRPCCTTTFADGSYFGEFKKQGGEYVPTGTGAFYYTSTDSYVMCESVDSGNFNGAYFERRNGKGLTDAGFYKNGKTVGPHMQFDCLDKKTAYVSCIYQDDKGAPKGPIITMLRNDEYYISQVTGGKETGNRLHFKNGRLLFEHGERADVMNALNLGWGYWFPVFGDGAKYYKGANYVSRPAYVKNYYEAGVGASYEYVGGVQCYGHKGGKVAFKQDGLEHRYFTDKATGLGVVPLRNGGTYFGAVEYSPDSREADKGGFTWNGLGCHLTAEGATYLGEYSLGQRHGAFLVKDGGTYYFRSYERGQKAGVEFEMTDEWLYFRPSGDEKGKHYAVRNEDFTVYEVSNGKLVTVGTFDEYNFKAIDDRRANEDRVPPYKLAWLEELGLKYRVTNDAEIWVTGCTRKDKELNIYIPEFVEGVDESAFENKKNLLSLKLVDGVKYVAPNAFKGCVNLKSVDIGDSIRTIGAHSFENTGVKGVYFPKSVGRINTYAFWGCKALAWATIASADCVVEPYAFPNGCQVKNKELTDRELEQSRKELEERVAKIAEEIKEKRANKEAKKKEPKAKKPQKCREKKEREGSVISTILSAILGVLGVALGVLLFVPRLILKLFKLPKDWEWSYVISIATVVLGAITLLFGFLGWLSPIEDFFAHVANEVLPSLFGFRLTNAYSGLVNSVMADNVFFGVILTILYAVVAPFNLLLNVGVLLLVIAGYVLYGVVYGIFLVYGLGAVLIGANVFAIVVADDKKPPIWALIISVAVTVVYYVMFGVFYPV